MAAQQIRWRLQDLARRYQGPMGLGANHDTGEQEEKAAKPTNPLEWLAIHEAVDQLSEEEREVFNLFIYDGLSQAEIAELLGTSIRTIKRRWQNARVVLERTLNPEP